MKKIYTEYSLEFNLNRVLALYKWKDKQALVGEHPEPDGVSVKVWQENWPDYCGEEIGVFNYIKEFKLSISNIGKDGEDYERRSELDWTLDIGILNES